MWQLPLRSTYWSPSLSPWQSSSLSLSPSQLPLRSTYWSPSQLQSMLASRSHL